MQRPMFPLLSSSVHGPLGVKHLPRLWLKILLDAQGLLPPGYRAGSGGFDEFLTTTLGINNAAFVAYIRDEKPSYLTLETWVREHATKLTPESIAAVNVNIENADLPEAMRVVRYDRLGFHDETYTKAAALNDLDDWASMHEQLTEAPS